MKKCFFLILLISSSLSAAELINETELGIASANGNTKTKSYNFKQSNDYKWEKNVIGLRSRYLNSRAGNDETARYFMVGLRYEKEVSHRFGLFAGETFEKDRFANIHQRFFTDVGGKYRFIDSETTKFFSELGYRYLHEDRIDNSMIFNNYGRFYTEWENKWNPNFTTKYWLEYLPNLNVETDWQMNSELSLWATLTTIFSLKTAFLVRYDHQPAPGVQYKSDTLLTTALVAKF